LSATSAEHLARVVLDAGPLIALLHGKDPDHPVAVVGFERLTRAHTRLVTPLPVVFEVYKWLVGRGKRTEEARVAGPGRTDG
jgi:predicted nucleic acid-binding protein